VPSAPALVDSRGDTRFGALAVDPRFDRTHYVYIGAIADGRAGERLFSVVRYRELNGALGEGAVIVSALPIAGDGEPSFGVDADSRIYVSMPGGSTLRDPYAGMVLRFTAGGAANGAIDGSPILAPGYQNPSGIAWDGATMWSVGADQRTPRVSAVASTLGGGALEAIARSAISVDGSDRGIRGFAAREVRDGRTVAAFAWLDDEGRLGRARIRADATVERLDAVLFDAARLPTAFAIGAAGEIYAAVPGSAGTFSVLRLTAQGGKF
jgi:hypothetical protein